MAKQFLFKRETLFVCVCFFSCASFESNYTTVRMRLYATDYAVNVPLLFMLIPCPMQKEQTCVWVWNKSKEPVNRTSYTRIRDDGNFTHTSWASESERDRDSRLRERDHSLAHKQKTSIIMEMKMRGEKEKWKISAVQKYTERTKTGPTIQTTDTTFVSLCMYLCAWYSFRYDFQVKFNSVRSVWMWELQQNRTAIFTKRTNKCTGTLTTTETVLHPKWLQMCICCTCIPNQDCFFVFVLFDYISNINWLSITKSSHNIHSPSCLVLNFIRLLFQFLGNGHCWCSGGKCVREMAELPFELNALNSILSIFMGKQMHVNNKTSRHEQQTCFFYRSFSSSDYSLRSALPSISLSIYLSVFCSF